MLLGWHDAMEADGTSHRRLTMEAEDGRKPAIKALEEMPKLTQYEYFWYSAWQTLGSERPASLGGVSSIPFSSILTYARYYELSGDETDFLILFVRIMDAWNAERIAEKQARQSKTK